MIPDAAALRDIEELHRQSGVPGMQIAVLDQGKVAWHRNYGVTSIDTGSPVVDATLFEVASLSKPVFAYLVLQMVDQGRIGLDDRLSDYAIPYDYPDHPWLKEVTVRHVLTHQTGLPNWREFEPGTADAMIPEFEPGTGETSSGEAFMWLQEVVEQITDRTTTQLLESYIFRPGGIDAWLGWRSEIDSRLADGHRKNGDTGKLETIRRHKDSFGGALQVMEARWGRAIDRWDMDDWREALRVVYPAQPRYEKYGRIAMSQPTMVDAGVPGSIRANAVEYAKFMMLLMDGQAPAAWKLSEPTRHMMLSPHTKRWHEDLPGGMGIGIESDETGRYFYHSGNNGRAFMSFMIGHPASGRGIVILTNGEGGNELYQKVLARLIDADLISIT